MKINPKSQKGAVTLVVLVTMLFLTAFLMTMYIRLANKASTSAQTTVEIAKQYNNIGDMNDIYHSYFTDSNIIPITNREQLEAIGSNENITVNGKVYNFSTNGIYVLQNDIDLGGEDNPWNPLPLSDENHNQHEFTGILDGFGYSITGLYIDKENSNNQGLFGTLNGTVRNINIEDSYIKGNEYVGAIAGLNNGTIENCYNSSTIIGTNYVGGITGELVGTITNCTNTGNIIGDTNVIGGYFASVNDTNNIVDVWSKTRTLTENLKFISGDDVAIVPKGFKVSVNVDEQTIKDGLVIQDSDENEFVWVPVGLPILTTEYINNNVKPNVSGIYTESKGWEYMLSHNIYPMAQKSSVLTKGTYEGVLYQFSEINGTLSGEKIGSVSTNEEPENVDHYESVLKTKPADYWTRTFYYEKYDEMSTSVSTYGGFYVGRYEISLDSTSSYAQSKKNQTALTGTTWYNMYIAQAAYATTFNNLGVNSCMIWGSQWDQVMLFVNGKADGGNTPSNFYITTTGSRKSGNSETKTGMNSVDKVCNIFDLESGRQEWTQEAYGPRKRVTRGGSYASDGYASQRVTDQDYIEPVNNSGYVSSRLALYIKTE